MDVSCTFITVIIEIIRYLVALKNMPQKFIAELIRN